MSARAGSLAPSTATRPIALATAVVAIALVAATRSPVLAMTVAAGATVAIVAFRRRMADRARREADGELVRVERVGGCALAPGQSLHAVRFDGKVLLVGATASSIVVLDARDSDGAGPRPSGPAPVARIRTAALLAVSVLACAGGARAAHGESVEQRTDLAPVAAPATGAPEARHDVAPPLYVPAGRGSAPLARPDLPVGSGSIVWLAVLALAPFALMTTTSFVKISVVLSMTRSALGTPQIPSDPVLAGVALALTAFVMAPVAREATARVAESGADLETVAGALAGAAAAATPIRDFLKRNTRPDEIALFVNISARDGAAPLEPDALPVLVPAFVTSELRQAFVAGFLVFVPFLVIDLVVSNILMSMGMVMVSPSTVALPFKVLVFVLVDGWTLLMKGLALSYH